MVAGEWLTDMDLEAELQQEIAELQSRVRRRHIPGHKKVWMVPTFSAYMDALSDALTLAGNPWSPEDMVAEFNHCLDVGGVPPDLWRAPQYIERLRRGQLVPNKPFRDAYLNGFQSLNEIGLACGWRRNGDKEVADTSRLGRMLGLRTQTANKNKGSTRRTVRLWIPPEDAELLARAQGLDPIECGI